MEENNRLFYKPQPPFYLSNPAATRFIPTPATPSTLEQQLKSVEDDVKRELKGFSKKLRPDHKYSTLAGYLGGSHNVDEMIADVNLAESFLKTQPPLETCSLKKIARKSAHKAPTFLEPLTADKLRSFTLYPAVPGTSIFPQPDNNIEKKSAKKVKASPFPTAQPTQKSFSTSLTNKLKLLRPGPHNRIQITRGGYGKGEFYPGNIIGANKSVGVGTQAQSHCAPTKSKGKRKYQPTGRGRGRPRKYPHPVPLEPNPVVAKPVVTVKPKILLKLKMDQPYFLASLSDSCESSDSSSASLPSSQELEENNNFQVSKQEGLKLTIRLGKQ